MKERLASLQKLQWQHKKKDIKKQTQSKNLTSHPQYYKSTNINRQTQKLKEKKQN